MSTVMICPSCQQEVEITKIRTSEKLSFKYMSFNKAVGICPNCLEDVHIPEIDNMIETMQSINKSYVNILKGYINTSDISKDANFYEEWDVIPLEELVFDLVKHSRIIRRLVYIGTLKNTIGYDVVTLTDEYSTKLSEIEDIVHAEGSYYFITHTCVDSEIVEVCCMLWEDIEKSVSGIIFNKTDVNSFRYGKQRAKNKTVMV